MLLGNHEVMCLQGITEFANRQELERVGGPPGWRRAFSRYGEYGRWISTFPAVFVSHGIAFVHGGILPEFASHGVEGLNQLVRQQLDARDFVRGVFGDAGPLWTRRLVFDGRKNQCKLLEQSLSLLNASRMIVGHTINPNARVTSLCGGRLVDIDVGMSGVINGVPVTVDLTDGEVNAVYGYFPTLG